MGEGTGEVVPSPCGNHPIYHLHTSLEVWIIILLNKDTFQGQSYPQELPCCSLTLNKAVSGAGKALTAVPGVQRKERNSLPPAPAAFREPAGQHTSQLSRLLKTNQHLGVSGGEKQTWSIRDSVWSAERVCLFTWMLAVC